MRTHLELITRRVETRSGRISYAEAGSGPVALFVHGVLLSKHLWRHFNQLLRCHLIG
jgi:pimeloyl-ACP methyl ester carboxylesterase